MQVAARTVERIIARLDWRPEAGGGLSPVARAEVENARPLAVARLLEGRAVEEAAQMAALLLNVCGRAHELALRLAAQAAGGAAVAGQEALLRAARLEALREHMLALLHHWPGLLEREMPQAADVLGALGAALRDDAGEAARQAAAAVRNFLNSAECAALLEEIAALDLPPMPNLSALAADELAALGQALLADETEALVRAPRVKGSCRHALLAPGDAAAREDASLPQPLVWRLEHARRLAHWLQTGHDAGMYADAGWLALDEGAGLGWVLTARGVLVHMARLDPDGRLAQCRMLAPTEWHCAPDGLAARWLRRLRAADAATLQRRARAVMLLADPCEPFAVEVGRTSWQAEMRERADA